MKIREFGHRRNPPTNDFASQPREKSRAAHTSFMRAELSWATRFPRRCCDTVRALCRFTAHGAFIPSSSFRTTSDGTPRFGGTNFYLPSTRSIPERTNSNFARGSLPTRSVSSDLSREITCDTLATESFGSPVTRADKLTLPGARAHFRLLVSGTQTTVEIRLWFSASL